jgi:hypothetical protein
VLTWGELSAERPELTEQGKALLYQYGVGLAFMATSGPDGAPRVHPICPLVTAGHLYAFIISSPKQRDLLRDGRYALHSFPAEQNEDAFYIAGRVTAVQDSRVRLGAARQFVEERKSAGATAPGSDDLLVEFSMGRCLLTLTTGHGDPTPRKIVWRPKG